VIGAFHVVRGSAAFRAGDGGPQRHHTDRRTDDRPDQQQGHEQGPDLLALDSSEAVERWSRVGPDHGDDRRDDQDGHVASERPDQDTLGERAQLEERVAVARGDGPE